MKTRRQAAETISQAASETAAARAKGTTLQCAPECSPKRGHVPTCPRAILSLPSEKEASNAGEAVVNALMEHTTVGTHALLAEAEVKRLEKENALLRTHIAELQRVADARLVLVGSLAESMHMALSHASKETRPS